MLECNQETYELIFPETFHIFNSVSFNQLNKSKCGEVFYFLFKDTKYRLGLTAGIRNGFLSSPFSAPFGGFSFLKQDVQISVIEKSIEALENFAIKKSCKGIRIALPPLIYNETFLAKQINVLYRMGYQSSSIDLDFYIPLQMGTTYEDLLWYNAKKNLRISQQQGFRIILCNDDIVAQKKVYEILRVNRVSKGKPMNMSWDDVLATTAIVPTDFFLLFMGEEAIAGSIVYKSAKNIRYVPYWGDLPGYSEKKPMNFLTHHLVTHYRLSGDQYLHIGISTENSVPNYGLCEFKESIGCTLTPKLSFEKIL